MPHNADRKPILVTGIHRSGTTWVGKILALDREVGYISEPLNVLHRPGVMRIPIKYWYTYICEENEKYFIDAINETLEFKYHLGLEVQSLRSWKDALRMVRDSSSFLTGRTFRRRPLIKDPFAVFSSGWFASRLGCQVVITIRHPAGFVSSLKRLGWNFDFGSLLNQPLLIRDWLGGFETELMALTESTKDILMQGCLLWCIVYQAVSILKSRYPDFILVQYEDLSKDPVRRYKELYDSLGLTYSARIEHKIRYFSRESNPDELSPGRTHSIALDSQANLDNWKRRLTAEEISRVKQLTARVYPYFYDEQDWQ
jgi:hypothetical protein